MLPSPAELTYFSEIANSLNLSRASKKLGVSQPSLSLAIKRLESTLGVHLLIRHKKGVTLTPAGEKLLVKVKPLMQQWEKTKIDVKDSHHEVQGTVTIGCRSITPLYMKTFLLGLMEQHPKLEINFMLQASDQTTDAVINSTVDIGIVVKPAEHCDLVIKRFNSIEMSFWARCSDSAEQDIHSGQAVIICEPNVPQVQMLLKKLKRSDIQIARVVTANDLDVVAQFAIDGLGIGILPTCVAEISHSGKLHRVLDLPARTDDLCMIYRYENKNVLAVKTVLNALNGYVSSWDSK